MSLSDEQLVLYERDGIIPQLSFISREEALALASRHGDFEHACIEHLGEIHWFKTYLLSRWIFGLVTRPLILDYMEDLLGPNLLLWGVDMFYKPPHSERFTAMHQDSTYWGLEPADGLINAWIALTPSTVANGCLRLLPCSHQRGQVDHSNEFEKNNVLVHGQNAAGYDLEEASPVELEAGQMTIFHLHTVHGSGKNTTPQPRLGLAVRYIRPEVRQVGRRDSALLVRGEDKCGNFDHELAPAREFDKRAVEQFTAAMARPSGAGNSGGIDGLDKQRADAGHGRAFHNVESSGV